MKTFNSLCPSCGSEIQKATVEIDIDVIREAGHPPGEAIAVVKRRPRIVWPHCCSRPLPVEYPITARLLDAVNENDAQNKIAD